MKSLGVPVRFFERDSAWCIRPSRFEKSELPPNQHPDYHEDRRLIYVPAVPSSGTSALCAVLMMLGVDMGRFPLSHSPSRGYVTYEDMDYNLFRWEIQGPQNRLLRLRVRFRDYINYRFVRTKDKPVGSKGLPLYIIQDEDPVTLPIVTVDIHRPVDDALIADFRTILSSPERDAEQEYRTVYDHASRGGGIAACFITKLLMFEIFPPVMSINYYEMLEEPEQHVKQLNAVLGLKATDDQIQDAIRVIHPEARHV